MFLSKATAIKTYALCYKRDAFPESLYYLIEDLVWELEPRSRTFVERGSARIQMGLEVSDIVVGLVKKGTFIEFHHYCPHLTKIRIGTGGTCFSKM
jgi:hypothetical protein